MLTQKIHSGLAKTFIIVSIFVFGMGIFVPHTFAQLDVSLRESDITISMSPEIPKPNQLVTITVSSYSMNLDSLTIIWKKNGIVEKTGIGTKSISLTSPKIGENMTITAEIFNRNTSVKKTVVVNSSEIDLLWEATNTYTLPFYKGKALPGSEGDIKIVAMPNTGSIGINSSDLIYTWKRNFVSAPSLSGFGKQSINTKLDFLNPSQTIDVNVKNVAGTYTAEGTLNISPINPKILFYETNPSFGLLTNKTLRSGTSTTDSSFELFAAPFFFSTKNLESKELTYDWTVGGKSVPKGSIKNRLTLQFADKAVGATQVNTEIQNGRKLFQKAQTSVSINKK